MKVRVLLAAGLTAGALAACGGEQAQTGTTEPVAADDVIEVSEAELAGNPFLEDWDTPYGVQPFDRIDDEHFLPAFKYGVLEQRREIAAIAENTEAPTFDNTILALEKAGGALERVAYTFSSLTGTELNDRLRELQTIIWPMYSRENDAILLNETIWQRVQAVYTQREELGLDEQQARLLELTHRRFVRAGAALSEEVKAEVSEINAELSELTTRFGQNVLAATKDFRVELTSEEETAGLADDFKANLWDEDKEAWVLTLDRSVYETFMTQSENREARKVLFDGYRNRANSGEYDNGPTLIRIAEFARAPRRADGLCIARSLPARNAHGQDAAGRRRFPAARMAPGPRAGQERACRHAGHDR